MYENIKDKCMKISGLVIRKRNITVNTDEEFQATYKGKRIYITTNHGFGSARYKHLKRYLVDVIDIETGLKDVDAYDDFYEIKDAIRYSLIGAGLLDLGHNR